MTTPPPNGANKPRSRRGSETRKRSELVQIRYTPEEHAQLDAAATAAELTLSAYIRHLTVGAPPPIKSRPPSLSIKLAAKHLAELGKCGSNLNQIARRLNADFAAYQEITGIDAHEAIEDTLIEARAFRDILAAILRGSG
jgi:hypothetical protein